MRCALGISLPTKKLHLTRKRVAKRILKTHCTQCIIQLKIALHKSLIFTFRGAILTILARKFKYKNRFSNSAMIHFSSTIAHCERLQVNFKGDFRSLESFHFLSRVTRFNSPRQNFEKHTQKCVLTK